MITNEKKENMPPEKKTLWKTSFRSTKSGAGESFCR